MRVAVWTRGPTRCLASLIVAVLGISDAAEASQNEPPRDSTVPVAPATVTRDDTGNATMRAVRLDRPLLLDGRLDEAIYQTVPPVGGFIQQLPVEGVPATEPTEVWVFYDDANLYVVARCYDSEPEREVVTELRRDGPTMSRNDNITVVLDTFYDRRNGYYFQTNPAGAVREQALVNARPNPSWDTVWDVRASRSAQGYTVEMVIPFKSLRYRRAGPQTWGINFRRTVAWKNEVSTLTRVPAAYGSSGVIQMAVAGTLVGVETPAQSKNVEVKPYVVSTATTDRTSPAAVGNDVTADVGVDFKYGLTRSLIADVTVNTDFAQVEEDIQQINLTRFSLFFPEKRDFFLEGQGIFAFGGSSARFGGGDVPTLFFSRRIGLSQGQAVPVVAGARVTGKTGPFDVGLLTIRTSDKPSAGAVATNFSAVRVRRDILRRSSVGMIATGRWPAAAGRAANLVFGVDTNLAFFQNIEATLYWARTTTPGVTGGNSSYRGHFEYGGDRYGLTLEHLLVGAGFNPEVGFVRRQDFRRSVAGARFSPRLSAHPVIRRLI